MRSTELQQQPFAAPGDQTQIFFVAAHFFNFRNAAGVIHAQAGREL